jgi:hypothetical protein
MLDEMGRKKREKKTTVKYDWTSEMHSETSGVENGEDSKTGVIDK